MLLALAPNWLPEPPVWILWCPIPTLEATKRVAGAAGLSWAPQGLLSLEVCKIMVTRHLLIP